MRWHLKAGNEEKITSGEGYTRKENCLAALELVRNSSKAAVTETTP
jgi:uncharacterized protein YegP (UPF0339 family)